MEITVVGYKIRVEILLLIGIVYLILVSHTVGSCCNFPKIVEGMKDYAKEHKKKEAKKKANEAQTNEMTEDEITEDEITTTTEGFKSKGGFNFAQWGTIGGGGEDELQPYDSAIPFLDMKFSMNCCPSAYSNSMGCACMTDEENNHLATRGYNASVQ